MNRNARAGITRRQFVGTTLLGAAAGLDPAAAAPSRETKVRLRRTAIDLVPLGKSGVKVTRLGVGSGTDSGRLQRELGQEGFKRLMWHAYDRGVRFFDMAESYQTHSLFRQTLRPLPRDQVYLQTKISWNRTPDVSRKLDTFRKEVGTDYFDSLLIHCTRTATWVDDLKRMREELTKAKEKGIIRCHGVSCHGLDPLTASTRTDWVDVQLVRVNHNGRHMDGKKDDWNKPGDVKTVVDELTRMHRNGRGIIGMKLIGNGDFRMPREREASIRFVMNLSCIDAVLIGFKNAAEVDEALKRITRALNA